MLHLLGFLEEVLLNLVHMYLNTSTGNTAALIARVVTSATIWDSARHFITAFFALFETHLSRKH